MSLFYEVKDIPVHSCLLMTSRQQALEYARGQLRLGFCTLCGFISNVLFDPHSQKFSSTYEETQGFSPRFRAFARQLTSRLIERYNLRNKDILEIGCGKGEFLVLLCELGGNRGIGIDPAYVRERTHSEAADRITFITDLYSEQYAHLTADFVCCRHTLEHIQPTAAFVRMVRRAIGNRPDTIVFFEVPDVARVLKEQAFWDIYYEHCSYFSLGSLARLFRACGFEVLDLAKDFDEQYLLIEARPSTGGQGRVFAQEDDLEDLAHNVRAFQKAGLHQLAAWKDSMQRLKTQGQRAVLWGSGSKAVAFLTTLGIHDEIEYVVDINPYKHGMFLAGTGHEIVPPTFLTTYRPDVVIAMNPVYRDEIGRDLDKMGVAAELVTV
jgi:2-polyprenyl-3-methyl-5-hydroxy-6-metoxy-1,4-benzoquinol methylase